MNRVSDSYRVLRIRTSSAVIVNFYKLFLYPTLFLFSNINFVVSYQSCQLLSLDVAFRSVRKMGLIGN